MREPSGDFSRHHRSVQVWQKARLLTKPTGILDRGFVEFSGRVLNALEPELPVDVEAVRRGTGDSPKENGRFSTWQPAGAEFLVGPAIDVFLTSCDPRLTLA